MSSKKNIFIVAGLVITLAGVIAFFLRPSGPKGDALAAREHAMELLGTQIAKQIPNAEVLVLSNPFAKESGPFDEKSQFEKASIRGLRKGLGEHSSITVVFPEIPQQYLTNPQLANIPPDARTPLSFMIRPESVDQLAQAHPECRVIVSLIGLPAGVDQLKIWNDKESRSFALLLPDLRLVGPPNQAVAAFEQGKLLAAVANDLKSSKPFIVTKENIAKVLEQQPNVLGY